MRDYTNITMINVQKKTILDYIYSNTAQKFTFILFLASVFVFGLMYGYGYTESPKFFPLMAAMAVYMLLNPKLTGAVIDLPLLILFIIYLLMSVHQVVNNPYVQLKYNPTPYAWIVPTVYILGKLIVGNSKEELEIKTFAVLLSLGMGMHIQGVLNYSNGFKEYDPNIGAVWHVFWTTGIDGARTLYNFGFLIIIGLLVYSILLRQKALIILSAILNAIAIVLDVYYQGRTMVAMVVLALASMLTLYYLLIKRDKKRIVITIVLFVVLLAAYAICSTDQVILSLLPEKISMVLTRDGGLLHNLRFQLWSEGIRNIATSPKGGWNLDESVYGLSTPHNSWLEFARMYDAVIFGLWVFFLGWILICGIRTLIKYGEKHKILYWAAACEIMFFLIGMIEPYMTERLELQLFFVFIIGIVNGVERVAATGDYGLLNANPSINKYKNSAMATALLSTSLIVSGYMAWLDDRLQLYTAVIIPILALVVGSILIEEKYRNVVLITAALCSGIAAVYMYVTSINNEYFAYGYFVEIYTKVIVEKSAFLALCILPIAAASGMVTHKLKLNKILVTALTTIITGAVMLPQIRDGRLNAIKEALKLQLNMKSGGPWIASKTNTTGLISSHSLWLDFARDYGMITFGLLMVFEIWAIACFIKLVLSNRKVLTDYMLIVAFVLFNYFFMFEASAITSKYLFAIGMFVYGMVIAAAENTDIRSCNDGK